MTEHPILFNSEMVRAILDGRKTQTRRVIKPQPIPATVHPLCTANISYLGEGHYSILWDTPKGDGGLYRDRDSHSPFLCPYGIPGDRLWVRETWNGNRDIGIAYKATDPLMNGCPWRPSIHMPRWASRITLEVTNVQVERVQDISEEDAKAEGVCIHNFSECQRENNLAFWELYRHGFRSLWDSINGKRGYGWDSNPWVWVVKFKVV